MADVTVCNSLLSSQRVALLALRQACELVTLTIAWRGGLATWYF